MPMLQYGKEPKAKTEVKKKKPPGLKNKFTAVQVDKRHRILRELPERAEQRVADVQSRHEMLRAA